MTRFSRPVIISSTAADWPARPIMRRTAIGSRTTSWPPTSSDPRSGWSSVATMRMNVVLPAPLGPRMATGLPGRQREREIAECLDLPEFLTEAVGLDERVHSARLLSSESPLDGGRLRS